MVVYIFFPTPNWMVWGIHNATRQGRKAFVGLGLSCLSSGYLRQWWILGLVRTPLCCRCYPDSSFPDFLAVVSCHSLPIRFLTTGSVLVLAFHGKSSCWGFCFLFVILSCFAAQAGFEISPAAPASQVPGFARRCHHALLVDTTTKSKLPLWVAQTWV